MSDEMRVSHPPRCESCDRLREANRRLQAEGPALERDKLIVGLRETIARLTAERDEARDQLASIMDAYELTMSERCAPDEKHCTCVPFLRDGIKTAEAKLDAARKLAGETVEALEDDEVRTSAAYRALAAKWREWSGGQ